MDRQMTLRHLDQVEQHVIAGARNLVRQREAVATLRRDGHDTARAMALLAEFEDLHARHTAELARLRRQLAGQEHRASGLRAATA